MTWRIVNQLTLLYKLTSSLPYQALRIKDSSLEPHCRKWAGCTPRSHLPLITSNNLCWLHWGLKSKLQTLQTGTHSQTAAKPFKSNHLTSAASDFLQHVPALESCAVIWMKLSWNKTLLTSSPSHHPHLSQSLSGELWEEATAEGAWLCNVFGSAAIGYPVSRQKPTKKCN